MAPGGGTSDDAQPTLRGFPHHAARAAGVGMKLGLGVFSGEAVGAAGLSHTDLLRESLDEMALAEEVGLDSVWITEHHFLESGYIGSVLPYAAAAAVRTSRITVGISVALAPLYDPIRLAEDAAFVDQLSGGRLELGLALGYRDEEYAGYGIERRHRVGRTEELCALLRQSWADAPVDFAGRHFERSGFSVYPKPVSARGIRILMGGHVPAAIDRVARLADAFIMDGGTDSDAFGEAGTNRDLFDRVESGARLYREARERHGLSGERLPFYLTLGGFLHADGPDAAWQELQHGYMLTRRTYADWYGLPAESWSHWHPETMSAAEHAQRRTEVVLGTPDDVLPTIERLRDIVGDGLHVMFRTRYPGVSHVATAASIRLLGELRSTIPGTS